MIILGINAFHGDTSVALIKNNQLIFGLEEERIGRIKHNSGFTSMSFENFMIFIN